MSPKDLAAAFADLPDLEQSEFFFELSMLPAFTGKMRLDTFSALLTEGAKEMLVKMAGPEWVWEYLDAF